MPIVACSKEEQKPWTFGWYPYADRLTDRSIVASDRPDPSSAIVARYGAPFSLQSHDLPTADYWLVGPDGPLDGFVGIERKERDLASSLTADMARFKDECDRLRAFTNPLIVTSCTLEDLVSSHPQHEPAFVGGISVIAARYRIPLIPCASRPMAERFAARFLWECWQSYLSVNPSALAWAREDERKRGIVHDHRRAQTEMDRSISRDAAILHGLEDGVLSADPVAGTILRNGALAAMTTVQGYAVFSATIRGTRFQMRAHRVIWMAARGPISGDMVIDHINRDRLDNRIENLRVVTFAENSANRRAYAGAENPNAKIDTETVDEIRAACAGGATLQATADRFGMSYSQVRNIVTGAQWVDADRVSGLLPAGGARASSTGEERRARAASR